MAKAIKDRVSLIKRKREQRQLVREEQEKRKQEESSFKQQVEQQPSTAQAGVQQPPATSTGGPAASAASASVSTQVEPEEPEADQHQQLQYQQPGVSVICEYQGPSEVARHALSWLCLPDHRFALASWFWIVNLTYKKEVWNGFCLCFLLVLTFTSNSIEEWDSGEMGLGCEKFCRFQHLGCSICRFLPFTIS